MENWINGLSKLDLSKNKYSQYGEEIIIQEIFKQIETTSRYYVDLGAGLNISNTKLLKEQGWDGLAFDMSGGEGIIQEFITPDNILSILEKYKCHVWFDFLSIDLDGFDYDILDNVLSLYTPRVICAEFNGTLDPETKIKLSYEDGYTWDHTNKYGFSFGAGIKLLKKYGYTIVFNSKETNMIAVLNSLLPPYRPMITARQNYYHPINTEAKWEQV